MADHTKDEGTQADERTGLPVSPKQVASLVVLLLVVVFCAQNTGDTEIKFFWTSFESKQFIWLLGVLVVGVLAGLLLPYGRKKD